MLEPDEDEDPTRICVKCEKLPRWSKHRSCKLCVQCAGKGVVYCLRVRKDGPPPTGLAGPRAPGHRDRYAKLRAAGGSSYFARNYCTSPKRFEMALRQLRGCGA